MWAIDSGIPFVNAITCEHYTADVVPKSEVEKLREINNSLLKAGQEWQKRYENLARELLEELEDHIESSTLCSLDIEEVKFYITELKNKHGGAE
jgi:FtsZ-binding cell division protein ZapB